MTFQRHPLTKQDSRKPLWLVALMWSCSPWAFATLWWLYGTTHEIVGYIAFALNLPGGLIAIALSGNVHTINETVIFVSNIVIYYWIALILVGFFRRRQDRKRSGGIDLPE